MSAVCVDIVVTKQGLVTRGLAMYGLVLGNLVWGPGKWEGHIRSMLERMTAVI